MRDLVVRAVSRRATTGIATIGPVTVRCGLGRMGMRTVKREGDGATPIGRWRVVAILYRADRGAGWSCARGMHRLAVTIATIKRADGWCDATGDRNYNRAVRLPYPASAETMWRDDHLYDVVVVLDHNQRPRVQGGGSAIFLHLAREAAAGGLAPTAGCVSLRRRDLAVVLGMMRRTSAVRVIG